LLRDRRAVQASRARPQPIDFEARCFPRPDDFGQLRSIKKLPRWSLSSQVLLGLAFLGALWGFYFHEKKIQSPMIDLSFFSILPLARLARFTLCCITQGMTSSSRLFYLQDVLKLSPSFIGISFSVRRYEYGALARERRLTDRIGARFLLILGVLVLMAAFLSSAPNLRADSALAMRACWLALTGIGSAFFNTPSQAVMVSSLPKDIGVSPSASSTGFLVGTHARISLSGFFDLGFPILFRDPGTTPDPVILKGSSAR